MRSAESGVSSAAASAAVTEARLRSAGASAVSVPVAESRIRTAGIGTAALTGNGVRASVGATSGTSTGPVTSGGRKFGGQGFPGKSYAAAAIRSSGQVRK